MADSASVKARRMSAARARYATMKRTPTIKTRPAAPRDPVAEAAATHSAHGPTAPAARPSRPAATRSTVVHQRAPARDTAPVAKTLILAEMLGLLAVGFLVRRDPTSPWLVELVTKQGLKRVIAVSVLLAILMLMADLGLGTPAAIFGAVLLASYFASKGTAAGEAILALERRAFS